MIINILISNKYFLMNYAIRCILQNLDGFNVKGVAEENLLAAIEKVKPDIIISEIDILKTDSYNLISEIKKNHPKLKILLLLEIDNKNNILKMLDLKLNGYLSKNTSRDELITAVHSVYSNQKYYSREIKQIKIHEKLALRRSNSELLVNKNISRREKEILGMIISGYNNRIIAGKLFISENTVATHRRNIMKKMEVKNTSQLIMRSLKQGIVSIPD